jgi:hypothetical protein
MSGGCQSSRGHYSRGRLAKTITGYLPLRAEGVSLPMQSDACGSVPGNRAHLALRYLHCHEPEPCQSHRSIGLVKINSLEPRECGETPQLLGSFTTVIRISRQACRDFWWAHCLRKIGATEASWLEQAILALGRINGPTQADDRLYRSVARNLRGTSFFGQHRTCCGTSRYGGTGGRPGQ